MFAGRDITLTKETSDGKLKREVDIASSVEGTSDRQFETHIIYGLPTKRKWFVQKHRNAIFLCGRIINLCQ